MMRALRLPRRLVDPTITQLLVILALLATFLITPPHINAEETPETRAWNHSAIGASTFEEGQTRGKAHENDILVEDARDVKGDYDKPLRDFLKSKLDEELDAQHHAEKSDDGDGPGAIGGLLKRNRGTSVYDIFTFLVVLVVGFCLLPVSIAFRLSPRFRNALLDITTIPHHSYSKLEKPGTEMMTTIERKKSYAFQPRMLLSLQQQVSSAGAFRSVLSPEDVASLVPHLPYHLSGKDWQLLYATEIDGYSLHTAYKKIANAGPCLVVGMDTNRHVFLGFSPDSIRPHGNVYFGTGEAFVASVHPEFRAHHWSPANSSSQFVIATDSFLGFGGGGRFALWFDSVFERGTSEASSTFANPRTLASQESFKCVAVEIWGFSSPGYSLSTTLNSSKRNLRGKLVSMVVGRLDGGDGATSSGSSSLSGGLGSNGTSGGGGGNDV